MKKLLITICIAILCINHITFAQSNLISDTAQYLITTVTSPQVSSIGGEWCVIGLARSNVANDSEYYDIYYHNLLSEIEENNGDFRKYTEYSRIVLALTSIGADPENISGFNFVARLNDYEKVTAQGINGAIFALLALDCNNYSSDNRENYINFILSSELNEGGWCLSGNEPDPDITAMALQALSNYLYYEEVRCAVDRGIAVLSAIQNPDGGYTSKGISNSESAAQVLIALNMLGIPSDDERFIKNENTVMDNLLSFENNGIFLHSFNTGDSLMATEQAFYALISNYRFENGLNSLYDMSDSKVLISYQENSPTYDDEEKYLYFEDVPNEISKPIGYLAYKGILTGKSENIFEPYSTLTRAEFAAVIVRALNLPDQNINPFQDVESGAWYEKYISSAAGAGIINGISQTQFNPNGTVTKDEAAVMTMRAAQVLGYDTSLADDEIRNLLASFGDYMTISDWAKSAQAWCRKEGILSKDELLINPHENILRYEAAQMIYNLVK